MLPKGFVWINLCCSGSTATFLLWGGSALAQTAPLPTDLPGYQQFWSQQTPAQRVERARQMAAGGSSSAADLEVVEGAETIEWPGPDAADPEEPNPADPTSEPLEIADAPRSVPEISQDEAVQHHHLLPSPFHQPDWRASIPEEPEVAVAQAETADPEQARIQRLLADGQQSLDSESNADPTAEIPPESPENIAQADPAPSSPDPSPTAELLLSELPQPLTIAAALQIDPQETQAWVQSEDTIDLLGPALVEPQLRDQEPDPNTLSWDFSPVLISQGTGTLSLPPMGALSSPTSRLLDALPLLQGEETAEQVEQALNDSGAPADLNDILDQLPTPPSIQQLDPQTGEESEDLAIRDRESDLDPGLLQMFPLLPSQMGGSSTGFGSGSTTGSGSATTTSAYAPELLERFPVFLPGTNGGGLQISGSGSTPALGSTPEQRATGGSQLRQQLDATAQREVPLDPDQLNVTGDTLSYQAERQLGIAEGNAEVKLSDGTVIQGDKLLFYRQERRLRSEGAFLLVQPGSRGRGGREIQGRNLDLDLISRTAQFESSLVILPGEEPGTKIYVRSEETTALLGDQIFFEDATITTSPEPPISHYVKGDRVEVFPDDRVLIYDARVFAGGQQDEQGDLQAGLQVGYFPLFVYSLKDHQWILPGQSEEEGVFVKSSWAYEFDQYNFGGLRVDLIEKKGLGLGVVHDYILPITDSNNYGRVNTYIVTEADEDRLSSRFLWDHYYDFYAANIFGNYGELEGNLRLDLDNTYRPAGGREDRANFRLNSTFRADLSTTTLNISRTGTPTRGTYSLPMTLNHQQRYGDVRWLSSNIRLDYNQRLNTRGAQDFSDARLQLGTDLRPPGWGSISTNYTTFSSSTGDRESRKNFDLTYTPQSWQITRGITFTTNLNLSQNQQRAQEGEGLNFFNKYDARSALRFNPYEPFEWVTITPGSIDYQQVLYSTDDQESTVRLNPRMAINPTDWTTLDFTYQRTFNGDNSVPFQTISAVPQDTHRMTANLSVFTPRNQLPNVPPGYIAFEDDLVGELPIPITFPDDTAEDLEEIAQRQEEDLQAELRNIFRFDTRTGYDWIRDRWDIVNADFSWNTTPNLFNVSMRTSYDPNLGELRPINLTYSGRSSTTFESGLRSGLDSYEPGLTYNLRAVYDPELGELSSYGVQMDATLGTRWQNHWRLRLGLDDEGFEQIEVRRDLRDFELRFDYRPQSEQFRIETILVAFPSQPVGLTQEGGAFTVDAPVDSIGSGGLLF